MLTLNGHPQPPAGCRQSPKLDQRSFISARQPYYSMYLLILPLLGAGLHISSEMELRKVRRQMQQASVDPPSWPFGALILSLNASWLRATKVKVVQFVI